MPPNSLRHGLVLLGEYFVKEANAPFLVMDIIIKGLSFPSENRTFHDESLE